MLLQPLPIPDFPLIDTTNLHPQLTSPIQCPITGPALSAIDRLRRASPPERPPRPIPDRPLLSAIRSALAGSDRLLPTLETTTHSVLATSTDDFTTDEELSWDSYTLVHSVGGLIQKKWQFRTDDPDETIHAACLGYLHQDFQTGGAASAKKSAQLPPLDLAADYSGARPVFGPFHRAAHDRDRKAGSSAQLAQRTRAVFVFLRNNAHIYLLNGLSYSLSIPFAVRAAWPAYPHGVILQRHLPQAELDEGEPLPTIFSLTNPFAELAPVGHTEGILVDAAGHATLKDEAKQCASPLRPLPAPETVITALSTSGIDGTAELMVSLDVDKRRLTVWGYAYLKPKDTPMPMRARRKRKSRSRARREDEDGMQTDADADADASRTPSPPRAVPGMAPSLSTGITMEALMDMAAAGKDKDKDKDKGTAEGVLPPAPTRGRRSSLTRNDLSMTMDRMELREREREREADPFADTLRFPTHARQTTAYWAEELFHMEIGHEDALEWSKIQCSFFDQRWDGARERGILAICLPAARQLALFHIVKKENRYRAEALGTIPAESAVSVLATRTAVRDLLLLRGGRAFLLVHGHQFWEVAFARAQTQTQTQDMDADDRIVGLSDVTVGAVTVRFADGARRRASVSLYFGRQGLVAALLSALSLALPPAEFCALHTAATHLWSALHAQTADERVEWACAERALYHVLGIELLSGGSTRDTEMRADGGSGAWARMAHAEAHAKFAEDPVLRRLRRPGQHPPPCSGPTTPALKAHLLAPVLNALHVLAEQARMVVRHHYQLMHLVPVICRIAAIVRPQWADYWKRLMPQAVSGWPEPATRAQYPELIDSTLPMWPPDMVAQLHARISNPERPLPWFTSKDLLTISNFQPSYAFGRVEPLHALRRVTAVYMALAETKVAETRKRAELAIQVACKNRTGLDLLSGLQMGIQAPIREAARTCQFSPPGNWPAEAYAFIGRNDLAEGVSAPSDRLFNDGYKSVKEHLDPGRPRPVTGDIVSRACNAAGPSEASKPSGTELDLEDFTQIRFGQDQRMAEVARMLSSAIIPSIKWEERPDMNEHEMAKSQQHQVVRLAERTLALPYGRALFTFGSVATLDRETYTIPKMEFGVRMLPQNVMMNADGAIKLPPDCVHWGEFHNGVAAGLRIAPTATTVTSSWIAFNKPSELTPEHAGFLYALGLNGHLRDLLTWHTFHYLTPKHDLTSIGLLMGLSAAHVGSGDEHVTKLLAVHTPALLPTPNVDLNVSLMTQTAGVSGIGLLYLGTKNRRMAEVCLGQLSRKDLVQPDLSNEHREAYTLSSGLAFGMIMLGKGARIPADMRLLERLQTLVHGETPASVDGKPAKPTFDVNLTSPAATIALGLMYLRSGREDVAGMIAVPETILELNAVQPSFLMIRQIARAIIMWDAIQPTKDWVNSQIPKKIRQAIEERVQGQPVDDAVELAYYNICAGASFAVALKYAGTAREEAYLLIIGFYDLYSRLAYQSSPAFTSRIKKASLREGLNVISLALSMIMAGTGEINCLRRLRYAYGMYNHPARYGTYLSTHVSLGLLFLGGGRFTLGTSDAAIACMIAAFYPRFAHVSSDNKCYLQALRHLWVLAVEPRCLIARDVDTKEVVYLPLKIKVREDGQAQTLQNGVGQAMQGAAVSQLISPTLIPDLDRLLSVRVDTPRYWPFYLDVAGMPRHRQALLRSQTLYVKRRTAFLSYVEDPKGARSLLVRSGSSTGQAALLDFPQVAAAALHPAGDLGQFIGSFSNDLVFLAFAAHLCHAHARAGADERLFGAYAHACLVDAVVQDKGQCLQALLTLFRYRRGDARGRYHALALQDARFAAAFYGGVYDARFSGRTEGAPRPPLLRPTAIAAAVHELDARLGEAKGALGAVRARYANGRGVEEGGEEMLAWYLLRHNVPTATVLVVLKDLARQAYEQIKDKTPPEGVSDPRMLERSLKLVVTRASAGLQSALGSGWTPESVDDVWEDWTRPRGAGGGIDWA